MIYAVAVVVIVVIVILSQTGSHRTSRAFQAAARRLELSYTDKQSFFAAVEHRERIVGVLDGYRVSFIRQSKGASGGRVTTAVLTVECGPDHPRELLLRPETLAERLRQRVEGDRDVVVRDERFDSQIHVQGPPEIALGLLSEPVREELATLLPRFGLSYRDRTVSAKTSGTRLTAEFMIELISAGVRVAQLLNLGDQPIPRCLLERAENDRLQSVRLAAAVTLLERQAKSESALELARRADWEDDELRLLSAIALEDAKAISKLVRNPETDGHVRVRGLEYLRHNAPELGVRTAQGIGRTRVEDLNMEVFRVAETRAQGEVRQAILEKLIVAEDPQLALRIVRAVHARKGRENNPLLRRLMRVRDDEVRRLAASQLGDYGRIEDVALLQELLDSGRMGGETRNAFRKAVHNIQTRFGTPESAGGLTIADAAESGALSPADD